MWPPQKSFGYAFFHALGQDAKNCLKALNLAHTSNSCLLVQLAITLMLMRAYCLYVIVFRAQLTRICILLLIKSRPRACKTTCTRNLMYCIPNDLSGGVLDFLLE